MTAKFEKDLLAKAGRDATDQDQAEETKLVERAPDDAIEPALQQSGNPPRAFASEDR